MRVTTSVRKNLNKKCLNCDNIIQVTRKNAVRCSPCSKKASYLRWKNTASIQKKFKSAHLCASRKERDFQLTLAEYTAIISSDCFYCGEILLGKDALSGCLDRVNNEKYYEIGNILPCCKVCNAIRMDNLTSKEMKIAMSSVTDFRNKEQGIDTKQMKHRRILAIDDVRNFAFVHVLARTYSAGIGALCFLGPWDRLLIDHDLGAVEKEQSTSGKELTGYDVCLFLEENPQFRPLEIFIVSSNPVGVQRMQQCLERFYTTKQNGDYCFSNPIK